MAFYLFFSLSPRLQGGSPSAKIVSYETPDSGPIHICTISFFQCSELQNVCSQRFLPYDGTSFVWTSYWVCSITLGPRCPPRPSLQSPPDSKLQHGHSPWLHQCRNISQAKYGYKSVQCHILYYLIFTIKLKNSSLKIGLILKDSHINNSILLYPQYIPKPSVNRMSPWKKDN